MLMLLRHFCATGAKVAAIMTPCGLVSILSLILNQKLADAAPSTSSNNNSNNIGVLYSCAYWV